MKYTGLVKTIYLVRHGESTSNAGEVFRGEQALLTPRGEEQAHFIAKRVEKLPIDIIVTSTIVRAQHTAHIINASMSVQIEHSAFFNERVNPTETMGKRKDGPEYLAFENEFWQLFADPTWRYQDAENFADLNDRAGMALQYLADRPENNILVVGHGLFSRVLAAKVIFGEMLTAPECLQIIRALYSENTGLSIFRYDPESNRAPWRIVVWNDHAHLADS